MITNFKNTKSKEETSQGTEKFLNAHPSIFSRVYSNTSSFLKSNPPKFLLNILSKFSHNTASYSKSLLSIRLNNLASRITSNLNSKFAKTFYISFFLLTSVILGFFVVSNRPPKPPQVSKTSKDSLYLYQTGNQEFKAKIGSKETTSPFVSFTPPSGTGATLQMIGSQSKSSVQEGNKIIYNDVLPNTSITYTPLTNGIKKKL